MDAIWKFVIWFVISLLGLVFLFDTIQNPFTKAFIIALIIAIVAIKDG